VIELVLSLFLSAPLPEAKAPVWFDGKGVTGVFWSRSAAYADRNGKFVAVTQWPGSVSEYQWPNAVVFSARHGLYFQSAKRSK